ncbi:MAG: response regulator transcription factor [Amphritea sp.]|nr:response regulator transcription factor [Amphritea sp.]
MMKILIADSSPLYRAGICQLLEQMNVTARIDFAEDYEQLHTLLHQQRETTMIIADSRLPGLVRTEQLCQLKSGYCDRVLMLCEHKDLALMRRILFSGVRGVIAKTAALNELEQAVLAVMEGRTWRYENDLADEPLVDQETRLGYALRRLSNQENHVLQFVRSGLRNKQIASQMELTEHTIKTHMSNILRKLEIENRTQLVVAIQNVQIGPPNAA